MSTWPIATGTNSNSNPFIQHIRATEVNIIYALKTGYIYMLGKNFSLKKGRGQ